MPPKVFNFRTGQHQLFRGTVDSDDEAYLYIPQDEISQGLYTLHRAIGFSPQEALRRTLQDLDDAGYPPDEEGVGTGD